MRKAPMPPHPAKYHAPALEKGLDILELLAAQHEGLNQNQVAQRLGRSVSEIYRMLACLEQRAYIQRRKPDDTYRLTQKLFELAHRYPPTRRLLTLALPVMRELAEEVRLSCHMAVYHDHRILVVARVENPDMMGFSVQPGVHSYVWEEASGRALLAFQPEAVRREWLAGEPETWSDAQREELAAHVEEIRARGYEIVPSWRYLGITDISFPIIGQDGSAIATLTVPYLQHRRQAENAVATLAEKARLASGKIATSLRMGTEFER